MGRVDELIIFIGGVVMGFLGAWAILTLGGVP